MVDFFAETSQQITLRLNGGIHKSQQECIIDFNNEDKPSLRAIIKDTCKRFGCKEKASNSVLYNKQGIQLFDEDIDFIKADDVLYIALDGETFNFCAILDDYKMQEKIGEGGFGYVHLATNKETNKQYAIKFMDMTQTLHNADEVNSIYKEANSIKKLKHKNIVELYHAFVEGKQLIMIMELAKGGELMHHVQREGKLDEKTARNILIQIVNAIQYCHSHGVIHRDLKLENVMFKDVEDCFVKVIDFGISGVCTTFQADMVDAGTIAYMPPECFEGSVSSTPAIDIWAIGLMFYAMLYGSLPFWGANEQQTKQKIREGKLRFPAEVPVTEGAKDVIRKMLIKEPDQRMGLLEFMDLEYYSIDQSDFDLQVAEVVQARQVIDAAEEEKRNEEQKLVQQFNAALDLPSFSASSGSKGSSAAGHRSAHSPARVAKKKKKTVSGSSPRTSGAASASTGAKTHKNKKTTK